MFTKLCSQLGISGLGGGEGDEGVAGTEVNVDEASPAGFPETEGGRVEEGATDTAGADSDNADGADKEDEEVVGLIATEGTLPHRVKRPRYLAYVENKDSGCGC